MSTFFDPEVTKFVEILIGILLFLIVALCLGAFILKIYFRLI